ncbi:RodZ domain-containing protein [Luteimonas deserti]|uniref:DUF4115 domain-containing protein n=1 Tax=Luteimonas deserti TaxID=2752306 RepID=A0A7Z0QUG2_9GAMM|nr:RodZ domain-containing protein [Luteimonas deserti]NYZ64244.1 DUF4115 domain-containing protein [Luteimonas deserti]
MSSSSQTVPASSPGVGERLRATREQAGLSVADVAGRLRMQVRVVEALEAENWNRLGAQVFVRGQLRSYLRLLKLPEVLADSVPDATLVHAPELTPRTYTPPMQRLLDKTMGRAVYVVITALIVVPVWVATRTHVGGPGEVTASLGLSDEPGEVAGTRANGPTPVTASLSGIPKRSPAPAAAEELQVAAIAADQLTLRFSGDSWVEVNSRDGRELERAVLRAGQERQFAVGEIGRVVLGNANAVEVLRGDDVQDLSGFQRASVARFTVSSDGVLAPLSE